MAEWRMTVCQNGRIENVLTAVGNICGERRAPEAVYSGHVVVLATCRERGEDVRV